MDKEYFTNLTNDLYRLTLLFPKKEPLRYKMRELADNVLGSLMMILEGDEKNYEEHISEIKRNIAPLDGFFDVAKKQNWLSENDVSDIQERYGIIKEEIEKFEKESLNQEKEEIREEKTVEPTLVLAELNIRQKKIVELLAEKGKVQVNDVQVSFPRVTKRTLRRDFDVLTKRGMVERLGKANMTFYKLADKEL